MGKRNRPEIKSTVTANVVAETKSNQSDNETEHKVKRKKKGDKLKYHSGVLSSFQKSKVEKLRTEADSTHNWNSLYVGLDRVADYIEAKHAVSKSDLFGHTAKGNFSVRIALAEAKIVSELKKFLQSNGVAIDAANKESSHKRSNKLMLVKNLPVSTKESDVRALFETYGSLQKVVVTPSGVTALVEFERPLDAKKAFSTLAYSLYKEVPLYLEWAALTGEEEQSTSTNSKDEIEPEPETTLFIKNINFKTTDEGLYKHFEGCGKLKYVKVMTKVDPKNPGNRLSMGYGFVQFYLKACTDKALKTLQQSVLDGKSLQLSRSEKNARIELKSAHKAPKTSEQTGSKILVKNVPFEANRKDLFELFNNFGEIKFIRLPKKVTDPNSHRGFAFVEYISKADAKMAFEALCESTHLFKRRLNLEWAAAQESVEEIRKRTARHFSGKEETKSKKSVFTID